MSDIFDVNDTVDGVNGNPTSNKPPAIVLAGPLGPSVRDVLNKQYVKRIDEATGIVLEEEDIAPNGDNSLIYCATEADVRISDLLSLTTKLTSMGGGAAMRASVILEGRSSKRNAVKDSIVALCKRKHVPIYATVEEFIRKNTP